MKANNTTGVKYLHIDYKDKYGNNYIVRYNISGKSFVVWRGNDFNLGKTIAEEVAWVIAAGNAEFLNWYDNERLEYLASLGTNDGSIKTKWNRIIGKRFGPYKIISIVEQGPELRESKVKVKCVKCGTEKVVLYKTVCAYKYQEITYCHSCDPFIKHKERSKHKNGVCKS